MMAETVETEVKKSPVEDNPFSGMKIKDWRVLDHVEGRSTCCKCNKSRKYFCYTCYIPVPAVKDYVPILRLPVKIDIIKHSHEIDGKSTAAHAAVIAPEDVTIYTYPCIPDYSSEENVVLIFPGKNALSIKEYIEKDREKRKLEEDDCLEPKNKRAYFASTLPISKAVFIDSTWNQSRGIYKDQRLKELPCVVFQSRISQFWRHQHGSPRWFLATIEAIHQFLIEFHVHCKLGNYQTTNSEVSRSSDVDCRGFPSVCQETDVTFQQSICDTVSHYEDKEEGKSIPLVREDNASNMSKAAHTDCLKGDKPPTKYVKNLALCRGVRVDPGGDPGISLFGPDQWKGKYHGEYDDLLFFFQFMYYKIHSIYDHNKLHSYHRPMH